MEIKKTTKNPYGLSTKQRLVIADMVRKVQKGVPIDAVSSTKKFYDVSSAQSARSITNQNMSNENFREALLAGLERKGILGTNSKVEQRLEEGLDATDRSDNVDYDARLRYIQEINKVAGVYAPEKKETKSLRLSVDMTQEELDKKIRSLQRELEDI